VVQVAPNDVFHLGGIKYNAAVFDGISGPLLALTRR
jgi:hypothetical protein